MSRKITDKSVRKNRSSIFAFFNENRINNGSFRRTSHVAKIRNIHPALKRKTSAREFLAIYIKNKIWGITRHVWSFDRRRMKKKIFLLLLNLNIVTWPNRSGLFNFGTEVHDYSYKIQLHNCIIYTYLLGYIFTLINNSFTTKHL